jgi:hypothetical protein
LLTMSLGVLIAQIDTSVVNLAVQGDRRQARRRRDRCNGWPTPTISSNQNGLLLRSTPAG